MGLDTVELVLTVEKTFDIEIPNKNAERITTVGELHQFVVEELIRLNRQDVNSDAVFEQIRNIVCIQLGVKPEKVIPSARFVQDLNAD